jgi:hypothetical protein
VSQQQHHVILDSEFNHKAISRMKNGRKHLNEIIIYSIIIFPGEYVLLWKNSNSSYSRFHPLSLPPRPLT